MRKFKEWVDIKESLVNNPEDEKNLAYDQNWNCAYCAECAPKLFSGEIAGMGDSQKLVPMSRNELRNLWANERNPTCSWCNRALWKPLPRPGRN